MYVDFNDIDKLNDEKQNIKDCIFVILSTTPKERVLYPEFGCNLKQYVFETMNEATYARMRKDIIYALNLWEKRISDIDVTFDSLQKEGCLKIEITYKTVEEEDSMIYLLGR